MEYLDDWWDMLTPNAKADAKAAYERLGRGGSECSGLSGDSEAVDGQDAERRAEGRNDPEPGELASSGDDEGGVCPECHGETEIFVETPLGTQAVDCGECEGTGRVRRAERPKRLSELRGTMPNEAVPRDQPETLAERSPDGAALLPGGAERSEKERT